MKFLSRFLTGGLVLLLIFIFQSSLFAQTQDAVRLSFDTRHVNDSVAYLDIHATLAPGIKLFNIQKNDEDLVYSSLQFDKKLAGRVEGKPSFTGNLKKDTDPQLESEVEYFTDSVTFHQSLKATPTDSFVVLGTFNYMYKSGDQFPSGDEKIEEFIVPAKAPAKAEISAAGEEVAVTVGNVDRLSIWNIFILGFLGGLLALITPCVYAMIPVTVSFFTKKSETQAQGIRNAISYSLSIIFIFTFLGFLITIIFGPDALNRLSTNWIANMIFFAIFLLFGISFLGAFDITLPSSWANRVDSKSTSKSYLGIFFMALTLVIVSFSCTGPIIGNLLVLAARGNYFGPLTGMFGFSLALGLPFAFFAFFPGKMNTLAKSGSWLNVVKVTLGFLELALALKFLSNADLVMGWRILDREVFIVLWVIIFAALGFYLIGRIRFNHDEELPKNDFGVTYVSIPRLFLAIISFAFALYMIPGLWGAPLKKISAFLPPMGTQDFALSSGGIGGDNTMLASSGQERLPAPVKYYDKMRVYEPEVVVKYGMTTYFDYEEALAVARKVNRPLMLDFTGINCTNCREMEARVWSDPQVMQRLKDNFVIASLYVDVPNVYIPKDEQYHSDALRKMVKSIGDRSRDIQISTFNANAQPYYFFLDNNENRINHDGYGYDPDISKFKDMLDGVVEKYKAGENTSGKLAQGN